MCAEAEGSEGDSQVPRGGRVWISIFDFLIFCCLSSAVIAVFDCY